MQSDPAPAFSTASDASLRRRGWELAHWAVANSSVPHIERVSYADREWVTVGRAGEWRTGQGSLDEVRIVTGQ